jgi:2-keto-4-pentenoate hydratase/2-oxohepta-3-ene-1,7-dioic acid hydratase in catechol pathway
MKPIPGISLQVQNIFCIGRNYVEHIRELGNEVPVEPLVFLKPTSAICYSGDSIELPPQSTRVDHEVEIVVAIGRKGKFIPAAEAHSHIAGIGIGIDLTARDLQERAKEKGLPWALAKGFDHFAPISEFVSPPTDPARLHSIQFQLKVNGELRQKASSSQMITSIPKLIEFLSRNFTLSPGDLIFTGTPKGVAPLKSGDRVEAKLETWTDLSVQIL